jgi:hypothetical protein
MRSVLGDAQTVPSACPGATLRTRPEASFTRGTTRNRRNAIIVDTRREIV